MCNWVRCASSFANPVACPASWSPSPLLFYAFSCYLENVSSKLVKIEQCLWAVAAFNSVVWGNDNTEMNSLSEEILLHIFGSLSAIHLCSASLVSKLWYSLICDDRYASIVFFDYHNLTEIQVYGKRSHNEGVTDCRKKSWKEVNGDHGSKIICCNWSRMA